MPITEKRVRGRVSRLLDGIGKPRLYSGPAAGGCLSSAGLKVEGGGEVLKHSLEREKESERTKKKRGDEFVSKRLVQQYQNGKEDAGEHHGQVESAEDSSPQRRTASINQSTPSNKRIM